MSHNHDNSADKVAAHFDALSEKYDFYKKRNWYYYDQVKKLYREQIPSGSRVLEIGCGTGDVLSALAPTPGVGVDISGELIGCAKRKYKDNSNLEFIAGDCGQMGETLRSRRFDYIFMSDVIEHLTDVNAMIKNIAAFSSPQTKLIISMANPMWEPLLMLLEKLGLKMPEGPHVRISGRRLEEILRANHFKIIAKGERTLIPSHLGSFSDFINDHFYRWPLFRKAGLIYFWVCQPDSVAV